MRLDELAAFLDQDLGKRLKQRRQDHSRSVAEYAALLAVRNGLDPLRARVAGLAHDLCREMALPDQRSLARVYDDWSGSSLGGHAEVGKSLVHGPAAAGLLIRDHQLSEADILEAIAKHTVGARGLGDLAKIVYAADKLEPGRSHVTAAFRQRCEALSPDELFLTVLGETIGWLRRKGHPVAEETLELYDSLGSGERRE
jgi:nicotinate-nucleotide adenylyltransferase